MTLKEWYISYKPISQLFLKFFETSFVNKIPQYSDKWEEIFEKILVYFTYNQPTKIKKANRTENARINFLRMICQMFKHNKTIEMLILYQPEWLTIADTCIQDFDENIRHVALAIKYNYALEFAKDGDNNYDEWKSIISGLKEWLFSEKSVRNLNIILKTILVWVNRLRKFNKIFDIKNFLCICIESFRKLKHALKNVSSCRKIYNWIEIIATP